jgi:hypothetical protein
MIKLPILAEIVEVRTPVSVIPTGSAIENSSEDIASPVIRIEKYKEKSKIKKILKQNHHFFVPILPPLPFKWFKKIAAKPGPNPAPTTIRPRAQSSPATKGTLNHTAHVMVTLIIIKDKIGYCSENAFNFSMYFPISRVRELRIRITPSLMGKILLAKIVEVRNTANCILS